MGFTDWMYFPLPTKALKVFVLLLLFMHIQLTASALLP